MPEFRIDCSFDAYCSCGAEMCRNCDENNPKMRLTITPCKDCIKKAYEEGRQKGLEETSHES